MKAGRRMRPQDGAALALGLAFLYGPILLVALFSFNASRLVTVWAGFSTAWYRSLPANGPLLDALSVSLRVALASAAIATVLGTLAAIGLARPGRFRSRWLLNGLIYAPMVMPEVLIGLSLLLLFVALGLPRGLSTLTLAHATLALPFVAVVVQARLASFDAALEEAARDLGATPLTAFATVTLPLIAPAVAAGFLLAFTLSLDDLVIASFASGPGATTLPVYVFSQARRGVTPEINAVATLLVLVAGLGVAAWAVAMRGRGGRGSAEP